MQEKISMDAAHDFEAKMPLSRKIPLGLQHVFAMFVGNLTPLLIIMGACGIAGGEFADLQVSVLQNAMFVAGVVTLVQLFSIGPIGGKVPIIMGTSSGFIGVFNSVAATMGGGVIAYGAIMGASILGGLFETVLGFFLKPLRKFFPAVVTGTVVLSIGLSLISVGINSFGGGNSAKDFGSMVYPDEMGISDKIETIAKEIYGAGSVSYSPAAKKAIAKITEMGFGDLPVCMAKTQYSLSDDQKKLGRPEGFDLTVRDAYVCAGAGFVVALTGSIMTMPGLPKKPAADNIDVDENGKITGLF